VVFRKDWQAAGQQLEGEMGEVRRYKQTNSLAYFMENAMKVPGYYIDSRLLHADAHLPSMFSYPNTPTRSENVPRCQPEAFAYRSNLPYRLIQLSKR
jgi:hypothetical protein